MMAHRLWRAGADVPVLAARRARSLHSRPRAAAFTAPTRVVALQARYVLDAAARSSTRYPLRTALQQIRFKSSDDGDKEKKEEGGKSDDSGGGSGKGFMATFMDTLKEESQKNDGFKDAMEQLTKQKEQLKKTMKETTSASGASKDSASDAKASADQASTDDVRKQANEFTKEASESLGKQTEAIKDAFSGLFSEAKKTVDAAKGSEALKSMSEEAKKLADEARVAGKSYTDEAKKEASKATDGMKLPEMPAMPSTGAGKWIKEAVTDVKKGVIDESVDGQQAAPYVSPTDRRREALEKKSRRVKADIKPDEETLGVTLHKSTIWESQWKNFTENSAVASKMGDLRIQFEESENILVRIARGAVERITEGVEGTFGEGETAQVMAEILRLDPKFDVDVFGAHCKRVIIPAVLEAYLAGDTAVLKDWCTEAKFSVLAQDIEHREKRGEKWDFKILDLELGDLLTAKLIDDQPLLVYTFTSQMIIAKRNGMGEMMEGTSEDSVQRALYIIYMRRNPMELDAQLAWEVADFQEHMMQE